MQRPVLSMEWSVKKTEIKPLPGLHVKVGATLIPLRRGFGTKQMLASNPDSWDPRFCPLYKLFKRRGTHFHKIRHLYEHIGEEIVW